MNEHIHLEVEQGGIRLDKYVAEKCPQLTRSLTQKLIKQGNIGVNREPVRSSYIVKPGDEIFIDIPPPAPAIPVPQNIPLKFIYEDGDIAVIDKPPGLTVHPAPGHPDGTLVNALLAHCPDIKGIGGELRPGIVHRLDKDTSGLMVIAKNHSAHVNLSAQMKGREITKKYIVLLKGKLPHREGKIIAPLGRDPKNRKKIAVVASGRQAITLYKVLEYIGNYTLVEATLLTGRTHQLRVHFSSLGFPVVGDSTYGGKENNIPRQFIHSTYLSFTHPGSGKRVEFTLQLATDLNRYLGVIKDVLK